MDFVTIIGLLGTLVTFEEAGRSWFSSIRGKESKRIIQLSNWDSANPIVQRSLDAFKNSVRAEYKEHIFSESEIDEIVQGFFKENADIRLDNSEKEQIKVYIHKILYMYNKYNRSLMTTGERIVHDSLQEEFHEVKEILKELESKDERDNIKKFTNAVDNGKSIGLENIEDLIDFEYEIDRSKIIDLIRKENCKFISILGNAGSGKSALCKKLLMNEEFLLYARAEKFVQEKNIDDIWECKIEEILLWLDGRKMVFFIDALEFIADCYLHNIELLQRLYDIAGKYTNVYIVTSCRTTDKNAFIKLQTRYEIKNYEIDDLSKHEIEEIAKKYPVINKMVELKIYEDLLKSPFYINLVVSNDINIESIRDENEFRQLIWTEVICLKNKAKRYGLSSDAIMNTVEKISFRRAKEFLLGVHKNEINTNILNILITEGIVVQKGDYVRLHYDIFEDICFEQYFDRTFDQCKGNYQKFYDEIECFGRCVYRRYQIWISNKLFIQKTRDKFVYALILDDGLPDKWKKQTEIGIVKSKYCSAFFEEYEQELISGNVLNDVIQITNLYAFEARISNILSDSISMVVTPIGSARESLILLIENNVKLLDFIDRNGVIKLCDDYSKQLKTKDKVTSAACRIIENYIKTIVNEQEENGYYSSKKEILPLLCIIFRMADASLQWLQEFLTMLLEYYKHGNHEYHNWACDLMEGTLKNASPILVKNLSNELCNLADSLWLSDSTNQGYYEMYTTNDLLLYGLSEKANNYCHSHNDILSNAFLCNIFMVNFNVGFEWAIHFVNKTMETYAIKEPEFVTEIALFFVSEKLSKKYLGNPNMWLAGTKKNNIPLLVNDIIYILKFTIICKIMALIDNQKNISPFASYVKKELYSKSNNIALLSIIVEIGLHFKEELPGFALDLATSFELLYYDIHRYSLYISNPTQKLLEKQIFQIVGIPNLKERYSLNQKCNINLQQYVANAQICFGKEIQVKCHEICDYLYSLTKNDIENASDYLQVQKMDMRNATFKEIEDERYLVEPKITGEAEKIVKQEEGDSLLIEMNDLVARSGKNIENGIIDYESINKALDLIIEIIQKNEILRIRYEETMVILIVIALSENALETERRDYLCGLWIKGINKYFFDDSFVANNKQIQILFTQLSSNISNEIKNDIKILILKCVTYCGENGLILDIGKEAKKYLLENNELAKQNFCTIVKLAENEMNHQKYNSEYYKKSGKDETYIFVPNMQLKLRGVDSYIQSDNAVPYEDKREAIIDEYLIGNKVLEMNSFDICDYDIGTLCYLSNCGLDFSDKQFAMVMKEIVHCMIDIWDYHKTGYDAHKIIDVYHEYEVIELFGREIVFSNSNGKNVIDILFDDIDFSKFTKETIEFYQNIFGLFLCAYFDAYTNKNKRTCIENKIKYIGTKIDIIDIEYIRIQLYKSLILSLTRYCHGDWSKLKTEYSYKDKIFLNNQFGTYGKYHVKEVLQTIYQLHMDELLPEVISPLGKIFSEAIQVDKGEFAKSVSEVQWIIDTLILKAFTHYGDSIKNDENLSDAFEELLETMTELNNEKAAVILDEFRIH